MPGSGSTLNPEWSLMSAACAAFCSSSPNDKKLNQLCSQFKNSAQWDVLFTLAGQHGVISILYHSLSRTNDVPSAKLQILQQRHQTNLHKSLLIAREQIRILDHLSSLDLEAMPYKGVALAESMYGDLALRQSGDIDLFIHAEDFVKIKNAVAELGYVPHHPLTPAEEQTYLASGYECAFDSAAGRNLLEVQWGLQPRFYAVDFDVEDLFHRAVTVNVAGREMKTPSMEDLLLVLSIHAAKHVWERMIWLCDIAQIMRRPELNWSWIEDKARNLGILRILRITLLLTNRFLNFPIPASAEKWLARDHTACNLVEEVAAQIISGNSLNIESAAYFRFLLRLRERKSDRLKFLQRLIFTAGPGEWAAVRLPAPLFPLYRLVRLTRLAARLIRA